MTTKVTKAEAFAPVDMDDIPDGDYPGVWGGYVVKATIDDREYRFTTKTGLRTMGAECVVHVRQGKVTVDHKATATIDGKEYQSTTITRAENPK